MRHFLNIRRRHAHVIFFHGHRDGGFGPHRDHESRHRGRGGPGPGRFFESGDLRYVILHLISDQPRHGYEIIKLIEAKLSGAHTPSPGIIYPTLTLLEEMGAAAVTLDGTRKLYTITEEGKRDLAANRARVDQLLERLQQIGERHTQERPTQIIRAIENLKMVLRMRGGQLTPEQMGAATDIIDAAAKQIERL